MNFEESRNEYERIPIPPELDKLVKDAVNASAGAKKSKKRSRLCLMPGAIFYLIISTAAAIVIMFLAGITTNTVFASNLANAPILRNLAAIITESSDRNIAENVVSDISIPIIAVDTSVSGSPAAITAAEVNAQIRAAVNRYTEQQEAEVQEYKQAFLDTGGTIEEWNSRNIEIRVDYEIKYQNGRYLSLHMYMYMSAFAFTQQNKYYNYDLIEGRELTLKDFLGDNYIDIANSSIDTQIREQTASDKNKIYFGYNSDDLTENAGFKTITDDTPFYVNSDGDPVICFDKYEIAPGYMGVCEFVIKN